MLAALVALLCLGAAVEAAVVTTSPATWAISYDELRPTIAVKYRHRFYYQIPAEPRGAVVLFHGCVHSGYNYFPRSDVCDECRGLPEEMSHSLQALNRGYAVVAISSWDRNTGCWSLANDSDDVKQLVREWQREQGLRDLPLMGMGISSGASFMLKMPRHLNFTGLLSEALGVTPDDWGYQRVKEGYPPTIFIAMMKDGSTVEKIMEDKRILVDLRRPVAIIRVYPRLVYPSYFSDRDPHYISKPLSIEITNALRKIGMLDVEGNVIIDPRYTTLPWLNMLKDVVPSLKGPVTTFKAQYVPDWNDTFSSDTKVAAVYSLMNLAYAYHEIISDYATVAMVWFESGGKADVADLQTRYTYGLPPAPYNLPVAEVSQNPLKPLMRQERSALEVVVEGEEDSGSSLFTALRAAADAEAEAADDELLAYSQEVEEEVDAADAAKQLPLSIAVPAHLLSRAAGANPRSRASRMVTAPKRSAEQQPAALAGEASHSGLATVAGGLLCGGAVAALLAAAVWLIARHRRSAAQLSPVSLGPATMQAVVHPAPAAHHHAGASARLSIIPGVKERFEYEVVEQTGSPFSARRRVKTAFNESPRKAGSPHKGGA
ncbi:hypothetical protein ACK3TF_001547 [Chlorella vulgaris]